MSFEHFSKRAQPAKLMLGEASSPFHIPAVGKIKNTIVYKIWTKYTMQFKSYEHFH